MIAPPVQRTLTTTEYLRTAEEAIIAPDERVELIDGEIVPISPQSNRHNEPIPRLIVLLSRQSSGLEDSISCQATLVLDEVNAFEPELVVFRAESAVDYPTAESALLVVEVGRSTLSQDLKIKLSACASAGIPEYGVFDVRGKNIRVPRDPDREACTYNPASRFSGDQAVSPLVDPTIKITSSPLIRL